MPAMLWEPASEMAVNCHVCAHACHIKKGKSGICGIRVNRDGELRTLVTDLVTAVQIDPVEKKPLYHFLPGSETFSIGSAGCNFHCLFCQNSSIAHIKPRGTIGGRHLSAEKFVSLAKQYNTPSVSFTYNEPTVFIEQMYADASLAKQNGLKTIAVSNGFMSPEFLQLFANLVDAANIDLKGFSDSFYRKYCGGRLQPVLDNLVAIKKLGWWLEVTTLLIPGVNDSPEETAAIANFIAKELGTETPWHISAFHGAAQMQNHPSTPLFSLEAAWKTGKDAGLDHVYLGNVRSSFGNDTLCPNCGTKLIARRGYQTKVMAKNGTCPNCGQQIAGVWSRS